MKSALGYLAVCVPYRNRPEHLDMFIPALTEYLSSIHHLASSVEQFDYGVPYPEYFGGVTVFPRHAFAAIDGFDNEFWGWGAEDDDLLDRVRAHGLRVTRNNGVFAPLQHARPINDDYEQNIGRLESNRAAGKPDSGLSRCRLSVKRTVELEPGVNMISVSL